MMDAKPTGLWGMFHRCWIAPVRAEPLAAFRILASLVILVCVLASLGPRMYVDLGPEGLTPADLHDRPYDPKEPGSLDRWMESRGKFCVMRGYVGLPVLDVWWPREHLPDWFVPWCESTSGVTSFLVLYVISLLAVLVGFCTRLSTLVALLLTVSFQARMSWVLNGGDCVMRDALFCLLLMPAGAVWSVDAWLRRRRTGELPGPVLVEPWSLRLAQIQLCCIYLFTGLIKLGGSYLAVWVFFGDIWKTDLVSAWRTCRTSLGEEDWLNGVAVYWVLNDVCINRFPYSWLPIPLWICMLLSWATLVFEIGFPLLVLSRWTRPILLIGGALFHAGIWFHTEVGFFSAIMVTWYPLFVSGAFLAWLVGTDRPPDPSVPKVAPADGSDAPALEELPAEPGVAIRKRSR